CPALDGVARTASYRGAQRVFMAQTKRSLGVLFGAPFIHSLDEAQRRPSYLLARARAAGYRSKAFYTLAVLDVPALAGAFDERDDALATPPPDKTVLENITSPRLAAR